jgi:hypothetical protein
MSLGVGATLNRILIKDQSTLRSFRNVSDTGQ